MDDMKAIWRDIAFTATVCGVTCTYEYRHALRRQSDTNQPEQGPPIIHTGAMWLLRYIDIMVSIDNAVRPENFWPQQQEGRKGLR